MNKPVRTFEHKHRPRIDNETWTKMMILKRRLKQKTA